jgi:hypothetical protein
VQRKDSKKSALSVLIVEWNFDCVLVFCDYNCDDECLWFVVVLILVGMTVTHL